MTDWTIQHARNTYNITQWGEGYFDINHKGHVEARPRPSQGHGIDLVEVAQQFREQHLSLPVLVRFTDILHDRIDDLYQGFSSAITANNYQMGYSLIYPIKVNQQHSIVQEIVEHGGERVGLEAGSKPELMAVLGIARAGSTIICNGYKDREYIRLALIGQQLGHRVYIVIEKTSELKLVLAQSSEMNITPRLGLRVRLASIGTGNWQNTGGEKSKFGLSAKQVLKVIEQLQENEQLNTLQMLHFHLGSQLGDLRDIQRGIQECGQFYAELRKRGVPIDCVDVGGGLGVDYEGTRSRTPCSVNYSLQEYASLIVRELYDVCIKQDLPHPHIFSESGRALTAHHAVLILNIIDSEKVPDPQHVAKPDEFAPAIVHDIWREYERLEIGVGVSLAKEVWHETVSWLRKAQSLFARGELDLTQRAQIETIYFAICRKLQTILGSAHHSHSQVFNQINEKLADKYFANFSLFQSVPDVWAIDQIFPVMPLRRLDEEPTQRAVLEDITCDSDGRIDFYVDSEGVETSLPVHTISKDEDYLLGIFLVGAYQEILGDMHNLFGDTDSLHVRLNEDGSYHFSQSLQGDTVDSVLRYVHFNPDELMGQYQYKISQANLQPELKDDYLAELNAGLHGYTYLEK